MIKLLFWIVLLAVVAFMLGFKRGRPEAPTPRREAPPAPPAPAGPESMVRCAECGTHLPASEALPGRGGAFCSTEHRSAHEARLESSRGDRT
ncbi:PP0621 family protein [Roseateles chitosanitabidus]|uniref:PP0621 family protein n=1 Tax=Roseateles chitosanitabidus TaxID=65048 RepID=UPI0008341331|nr:PP0621 family protein [Roseateles chitosanitabidus]